MMDHKICFYEEEWLIIPKLSQLPLIWSTDHNYMEDGWMTSDFTSFSTVFQSYQDIGQKIMQAMCSGTLFTVENISPQIGLKPRTSGSLCLSH